MMNKGIVFLLLRLPGVLNGNSNRLNKKRGCFKQPLFLICDLAKIYLTISLFVVEKFSEETV